MKVAEGPVGVQGLEITSALVLSIVSILLIVPVVGQVFSCLLWAYITRSDFDPLYQE